MISLTFFFSCVGMKSRPAAKMPGIPICLTCWCVEHILFTCGELLASGFADLVGELHGTDQDTIYEFDN